MPRNFRDDVERRVAVAEFARRSPGFAEQVADGTRRRVLER